MTAKRRQPARLKKGQEVEVHAGRVVIVVQRFESGAVRVINQSTGAVLRAWAPKEAREA